MKRILSLAMIVILSLSLLAGCGSGANDTSGSGAHDTSSSGAHDTSSSGADGTSSSGAHDTSGTDTEKAQNDTQIIDADTWDGSVASSFDGGDGSQASPYKIATSEQLAFLASEINSGNSYTGKHFALTDNLDLANIPWTPIGTNDHPFDGSFDGQGHRISNMKIISANESLETNNVTSSKLGYIGLFGMCNNSQIEKINISDASIIIDKAKEYNMSYIGFLVGKIETDTKSNINNITVSNSKVIINETLSATSTKGRKVASVGGIAGYALISENAVCNVGQVQTDISIINEDCLFSNYAAGVIGYIFNKNEFTCSDFVCYVSVEWEDTTSENYAAAIGGTAFLEGSITKLTNGYSAITTNRINNKSGYNTYLSYAIVSDLKKNCALESKNLFGYVKHTDANAPSEPTINLYDATGIALLTETNCKGCEELPENHGFDTSIWNVSDPKKPTLK